MTKCFASNWQRLQPEYGTKRKISLNEVKSCSQRTVHAPGMSNYNSSLNDDPNGSKLISNSDLE